MKILFITNQLPEDPFKASASLIKKIVDNSKHQMKIVRGVNGPNNFLITFLRYIKLFFKIIFSFRSNFDLIELHYIIPLGLPTVILKKLANAPLLSVIHGSDLELLPEKNSFFSWLVGFTLKSSDKVVVLSRDHEEKVKEKYCIDEDKIILEKFCSIIDIHPHTINKIKKKYQKKFKTEDRKILMFVGGSWIKGGKHFIKMFKKLDKSYYGIMIIPDDSYRDEMITLADQVGVDRIFFIPQVHHRTLLVLLAFSDILVVLSYWETLCVTALESLIVETPIISTKVGAISSYLISGKNGQFVKSEDPEEIKKKINRIIANYDNYEDYLKQTSSKIKEEYSLIGFSKRMDHLRKSLI